MTGISYVTESAGHIGYPVTDSYITEDGSDRLLLRGALPDYRRVQELPPAHTPDQQATDGVVTRARARQARGGRAVIGWEWEGAAPGSAGCGVSDDQDRAREAAEAWLKANPRGRAVLGPARLEDGTASLSAYWITAGLARRSRRLRDGRIAWARIPVPGLGSGS